LKKYLLIVLLFFSIFSNLYAQSSSAQLYFCEQYKDGKEIGVGTTFTSGWITVMLDLRPINMKINTDKVFIKITKVADKYGYYPDEINIDRIPFEVSPEWDYISFENQEQLKFKEPGIYRVFCIYENETVISSAFIKIIM
jgi:hypothetical protein